MFPASCSNNLQIPAGSYYRDTENKKNLNRISWELRGQFEVGKSGIGILREENPKVELLRDEHGIPPSLGRWDRAAPAEGNWSCNFFFLLLLLFSKVTGPNTKHQARGFPAGSFFQDKSDFPVILSVAPVQTQNSEWFSGKAPGTGWCELWARVWGCWRIVRGWVWEWGARYNFSFPQKLRMGMRQLKVFDTTTGEAALSSVPPAEPKSHPGIFSLSCYFQRIP